MATSRRRRPLQKEYDESQYYDEYDLEQDVLAYGSAPSVTSDELRELITQLSSPEKRGHEHDQEAGDNMLVEGTEASEACSKEAPLVQEHRQVDMDAIFGAFTGAASEPEDIHAQVCVRANAGVRENFLSTLDEFTKMRVKHRASVARVNKLKAKRRLLSRGRPTWAEGEGLDV